MEWFVSLFDKLIKNKKIFKIIECNRENLDFTNQKEVASGLKKINQKL